MRIVRSDEWRTMTWRNGGGITHELWREPAEGDFELRLSIAEIGTDGPFSRFPGVDRVITLLDGPGFRLRRDDGLEVTVDTPASPFAFSGDEDWTCELLGGPVRDFNVMSARGWGVAVVAVDGEARVVGAGFVLVLDDGVVVNGERLARHELAVLSGEATRVRGRVMLVITERHPLR